MPTPEFITELRAHIGTSPLWVPAVRGVVFRRDRGVPEVLLVKRSDNGRWTVTSGILEPGEDPARGAVREVAEETAVLVRAVRVAGVFATREVVYPNGDACRYLDTVLEMEVVEGSADQARPHDDESVEAAWFALDGLPEPLSEDQRMVIGWATDTGAPARFFT